MTSSSQSELLKNWPAGFPYPTDEEIAQARVRLKEKEARMVEAGYTGDWGDSLEWVMAAYGPVTWLDLFGHKHPLHDEMKGMGFFTNTKANI